ncbi:2'-5' RNA ligase family protein [Alkalihalobacillus sp. LMS6]|uniref:2'-5' RNA ligase family protein n=1 Tax=Alkalihalobacillus sp. LMS6 TaxID=2924034 RepID=UPI0020D0A040|nr:2'-5' RNA ligase family protein [Alkalihalobacillus sp. LMS6]UTR07105.1 2'-5' RNA ligase family protein [Alkalihalobacillus sp. LMS6]
MNYFIGIVPPEIYKQRIVRFQQQWRNNKLPNIVEPHITLKAQGGLLLDLRWLEKVADCCKDIETFQLTLDKADFFGDDVLFLHVKSEEILQLHKKIVHAVAPTDQLIEQYMELEKYVPHLTLGQSHWGLSRDELKEMYGSINKNLELFQPFSVDYLRIYRETEANHYTTYRDLYLKNASP